jgi:hypothetical protein
MAVAPATGSSAANNAQGVQFQDVRMGASRILADGSYTLVSSGAAPWNYKVLTQSGNTAAVKTGAGQLFGFFVGTATGNITIYDSLTAAGTKILDTSALVAGLNQLPVSYGTGLSFTLSGAGVVTAIYV